MYLIGMIIKDATYETRCIRTECEEGGNDGAGTGTGVDIIALL